MNCLLVIAMNLIYTQNFPVRPETFGTTLVWLTLTVPFYDFFLRFLNPSPLTVCINCSFFYIYVKYDQWNFGYRLVNIWNSSPKWVISANTTNTFETRLEKFSGTVAGTKSYSELLLLFLQARIQPTLDPCTEAFLWQANCANPRGEESGWRRVS